METVLCENASDCILMQSYQKILDKSGAVYSDEIDESEEPDRIVEVFDVETYFSSLQDKIRSYVLTQKLYLRIELPQSYIRLKIENIDIQFGSNCCIIVSINTNLSKIKNKRKLGDYDMRIYVVDATNSKKKIMALETDVIGGCIDTNSLVIYDHFDKTMLFTISSDLDVNDSSMIFKICYMDYSYLES